MTSSVRCDRPTIAKFRCNFGLAAAAFSLLAAGCSADVARFDFPTASLTDKGPGGPPVPAEGMHRSNLGGESAPVAYGGAGQSTPGGAYYPAASNRNATSGVDTAAIPEARGTGTPAYGAYNSNKSGSGYGAAPAPTKPAPSYALAEKGEQIEVARGDTLYGLSRRHRVSVAELMQVNGLSSPALKPGQKLYLPGSRGETEAPVASAPQVATLATPSNWTGSYTVKSGDSLYQIARANKIKLDELQRYNGIVDTRRVKPGTVLKVPGGSESPAVATYPSVPSANVAEASPSPSAAAPITSAQPTIINSALSPANRRVAELQPGNTATDAPPVALATPASGPVTESGKLRWPVTGKVVSGYGPRPDGTHNDGINISVPMGTEVHAADGGVVAYAGSELKGYGNLILLRHDNGWVTAYAHADELTVKRGDKVKRGDVIAKAGKTGQVDQPQLHFEVRQGQKPVDPTPFLDRL